MGSNVMKKYGLDELRESFLSFFESKGHLRAPSFSLVPRNDPSILLINAGMTPLKPYFTGKEKPPHPRMATCQKCIRTPDIENVGKTARHGTFFEMLGNFSFGDYFKKEAIPWAWEYFTVTLGIPEDLLYVSVYEEDDEAYDIWHKDVGLPESKIFRMGKADNFWEHGVGPCGPCSEIYFDRGPEKGCGKPDCTVGCDCDRFIEVWNNVFTQFEKLADGTYVELASKNIDTGMGLERLACVMQGVDNLFEVDAIRAILDHVVRITGVDYGADKHKDISIRVITDHVRSVTMMVSDGILPSNEGRGYVLRRLLRRAARHGRLLGVTRLFLSEVAGTVIDCFGAAYPNLREKRDYILKVITLEEEKFHLSVDQGSAILDGFIQEVKAAGGTTLAGDKVFRLHDTYGFPLDLTREIVLESGLEIDEAGFHDEMKKQKDKAREAHRNREGSAWEKDLFAGTDKSQSTRFVGYGQTACTAKVLWIVAGDALTDEAQQDDEAILVLDQTPFYAESGGQAGDAGVLFNDQFRMEIQDTQKTADGKFLHTGRVVSGGIMVGDTLTAQIDVARRKATARNHTATHLLHKALRTVLGDHVNQAGSFVNAERLRFDFTHFSAVTPEQLRDITAIVNAKILENLPVEVREMPVEEARKAGATALFGEKYGDVVRVVSAGDYSRELCGGTHLSATGEAGLLKIVSEGGVASGIRRIEAMTGFGAIGWYDDNERLLRQVADTVKAQPEDLPRKLEAMTDEIRTLRRAVEQANQKLAGSGMDGLMANATEINGLMVVAGRLDDLDMNALRTASDTLRNKLGSGVLVLASAKDGKVSLIVAATPDAVKAGVHAGNVIRAAAAACGGGGGGRPDMAQAGGKDVSAIPEALQVAKTEITRMLNA
jgi:alanyl-tRNA synthetase